MYKIIDCISQGPSSDVYKVEKDSKTFAMKKFNKYYHDSYTYESLTEPSILQQLDHPNIIKCQDVFFDNANYICMVTEFGDMDLFEYNDVYSHDDETCNKMIYQLLLAVQYLHSKNIIHRDIKPENVIVISSDTDVCVKMIDFSNATRNLSNHKYMVGTSYFLAPEIDAHKRYSFSSDVWALGLLFYEISTSSSFDQIKSQEDIDNKLAELDDVLFADFLSHMITYDHTLRWSCTDLLFHPYILLSVCNYTYNYNYTQQKYTYTQDDIDVTSQRIFDLYTHDKRECSTSMKCVYALIANWISTKYHYDIYSEDIDEHTLEKIVIEISLLTKDFFPINRIIEIETEMIKKCKFIF